MIRFLSVSLLFCFATSGAAHATDSLQSARQAFHAGSTDQAITTLQAQLESGSLEATDLADARHLLGRALMARDDHAQAAIVFAEALQADDNDNTTALDDHLRHHLALAMNALGRHAEAQPLFRAVARDPYSMFQVDAAYLEATTILRMGRKSSARKAFVTFLATYPGAPQMHDARETLAGLERDRGRVARAIEMYRRVIRESPQSKAANRSQLALADLAAKGHKAAKTSTPTEIRRDAEWLVSERRFDEALPILLRLVEQARKQKDKKSRAEFMTLLAKTYRGLGKFEQAIETSQWLNKFGGGGFGPNTIAFLLGLVDKHEEAEALILRKHNRRKSTQFWTAIGDHRMRFGKYAEAEVAYKRAAKKAGRWIPHELSRKIAWTVFNQGDAERSIELFEGVGRRESKRRKWSAYWVARALQEAGRLEEAKAKFEALQQRNETDFYGLMAGSRLREISRAETGGGSDAAPAATEVQPEAEVAEAALTKTEVGLDAPTDVGTLEWSPEMLEIESAWQLPLPQADARGNALEQLVEGWSKVAPEAVRAAELHRLGFLEDARNELRVLATDLRIMGRRRWSLLINRGRSDMLDNRRDKRARGGANIRHLGRRDKRSARAFFLATRNGKFRTALQEAREILGDNHAIRWKSVRSGILQRRIAQHTVEGYRKAYPIAWPDAMRISTRDHDVPPAFLYGIMTTESSFHPHAVSVAHAYGLVQMIPRTGRRVALELGYGHFMPEILLNPDPSIYMGGRYMGRLLDRFYDQEPLAAAAYNCGPHRVADWLKANPNRPLDVFVEEIPYGQARRYTKRVLSHTARYRRIYYGEDNMYVPNRLEARHRATPNY